MFEGYKVVVVCPGGRRRVADLMRRHVEAARPLVDELHWWLNTDKAADLEYMRGLARDNPDFYRTFELSGSKFTARHMRIGRFFRHTIDPDTLYIRIDDDVVWMAENCLEELVKHRLQYPDAYLVYGNIVNSSRFMHLHQKQGAFDPGFEISYHVNHATNRHSAPAGIAAHAALLTTLDQIAAGGDKQALFAPWTSFGRHVFGPGIHNDVNMICWFGRDFAAWRGICPQQHYEEKWICFMMPAKYGGRVHEACGNALCSHYASAIQWQAIDRQSWILEKYARFAPLAASNSTSQADTVS